ncbi:MAG: GNAT family N-acetyltransferase [Defluviitaleaceae bacterium]|nr:GNAT family N-acetyltransferase [Defluviitaleaceae bacterium]
MSDMLVKLYAQEFKNVEPKLLKDGITIKKAFIGDKDTILNFIRENFRDEPIWPNECEYAMFNNPITCHIAVKGKELIGFSCYDATARGFFGPMGVRDDFRGKGVGKGLLLKSLASMKESGYAYAIIGWPAGNAVDFYKKTVFAVEIPDSPPCKSIYKNSITQE